MKIEYDSRSPALQLIFGKADRIDFTEEDAEVISLETNEICALRVCLARLEAELAPRSLDALVQPCVAAGARFLRFQGVPFLFFQLRRAEGAISLCPRLATVIFDLDSFAIVTIGIQLTGDARSLFVDPLSFS